MVLVQAQDLARELTHENPPLVLDARYNLRGRDGHEEYRDGHVPGAIWVDMDHELAGPAGEQGRHPLPDPAVFEAAMRRVGLSGGRPVVVCDGGSTLGAARLWWMLRDAGHESVRVLDGGFAAWRAAGLSVATGDVEPGIAGDFTSRPGQRSRVDVADVAAGRCQVVDVRAPERYRGEVEPIDPVAGHIPGAVNLPAARSFADGRFRPAAELAELFADIPAGAAFSCGSGITAAQSLLAMEVAGRSDGALYPGSWSEWIADPSRPIATGPDA